MNATLLRDIVALGAITGMRSMAGPATLAIGHGTWSRTALALAAAEMVVDKTPFVGARTDALPLAGRAILGGIVGVVIAHERRGSRLLGGAIGAATVMAAAHVVSRTRRRHPSANVLGGVLEDLIVVGVGGAYAAGRHSRAVGAASAGSSAASAAASAAGSAGG